MLVSPPTDSPTAPIFLRLSSHHRDVEMSCDALTQLARHLLKQGDDDWTRLTATAIVHFFDNVHRIECDALERHLRYLARHERAQTALDRWCAVRDDVVSAWVSLRRELELIKSGKRAWLRRTLLHRFVKLNTNQIALEKNLLWPLLLRSQK